jgi:F0F1-type ATP synthase membrane subunit c/vacuolar-type H+-ATPase subunit K
VLRIEGAPKEAITATIDNEKVPPEALTAPYPRNPGKREVVVTAPGYKTARATVELVEGESKPVEVVLVLVQEAAPVKAPPLPHEPEPTRSSALIYLGAGITGTLAVVGVGTMIGVKALYGPAEDKLAGKCDRDCASEFDSLTSIQKALAYTSLFTFIGAGIVGGATLAYGATGKNSDEAEKGPHGAIVVTPGGGSFVVTGRW